MDAVAEEEKGEKERRRTWTRRRRGKKDLVSWVVSILVATEWLREGGGEGFLLEANVSLLTPGKDPIPDPCVWG